MIANTSLTNPFPPGSLDEQALGALGAHVCACERARGAGFALQCLAERVHEVVGPRMVTTVLAATASMVLIAMLA